MYLTARRLPSDKLIHSNSCLQRACELLSRSLPAWHAACRESVIPPSYQRICIQRREPLHSDTAESIDGRDGHRATFKHFFPPGGSRGLMISRSMFFVVFFFILFAMCVWQRGGRKWRIINLERREEEGKKKHLHASADNTPTLADNDTPEQAPQRECTNGSIRRLQSS